MIRSWFEDHPKTVGESYLEHQRTAMSFSLRLIGAGLACAVHAVFPALFTGTGSRAITTLHDRMVANRTRHSA